jgi:hypothetical protein
VTSDRPQEQPPPRSPRRAPLVLSIAFALLAASAAPALAAAPNDAFFARQWAASNTGQPIPTQNANEQLGSELPGAPGADESALEAWGVSTGSAAVVIGETDTGVDYADGDLAANIWSNPGGVGGCPAGTHGYNVLSSTHSCEPLDEEPLGAGGFGGHGTHVAGIMGAVGDNGLGVAGLNWQTTILPVKWLQTANSSNEQEHLVEALKWLVKAQEAGVNIRVVNDSPVFINSGPSVELEHEIKVLGEHQILFVTAAGNNAEDDDEASVLRYPCKYRLPNEICVTASNDEDKLASWANTGRETVNLAAPGVSIYSTIRGGEYRYLSGGSMAAAQFSGAAALILSVKPWLSAAQRKAQILDNVDPLPALSATVGSGGRLDVARALPGAVGAVSPSSGPAGGGTQVTISGANLKRASAVSFGSTSASFTVDSPSSITATAPPGTGTVDVTVLSKAGTSAAVAGDRFSYVSPTPTPTPTPTPSPAPAPESPPAGPATPASLPTSTPGAQGAPVWQLVPPAASASHSTPTAPSTVVLAISKVAVKRGRAAVRLRCSGAGRCAGTIVIDVKQAIPHGSRVVTSLLTIGRLRFSLGAGRTASISVALTAGGRASLGAAQGRLDALLTIPASATMHSSVRLRRVRLIALR